MPTLERTWTSSQNNVPADQTTIEIQGAYVLLALKNAFVSAGWTVTQSSDGLTTDTSDLWSVYTDVVYGNGATAHSWIVLQSPTDYPSTGNQVYFAIEWNTSADENCTFYMSTGDWTGGTTSTIGAAGGNKNTMATTNGFVNPVLTDIKYHFSYNTTGDVIFYNTDDSTERAGWGLIISKLADHDASDDYPLFQYLRTSGNSWGQTSQTYRTFGITNMQTQGNNKSHWLDGTTTTGTAAYSMEDGFMYYATGGDTNGNDINGKFIAAPIWACGIEADKRAIRGRLVDIYLANYNNYNTIGGTVEPSTGTIQLACITCLWVPADVVPSL
jgi:hypothetical protein